MITFYILSLIISKFIIIDQLYFSFPVFRFYNLQTLFPASLDNSHLSLLWKVACNNVGCIYNQLFIEKIDLIYPYFDKINILLFSSLVFCGSLFFIFYKNKKKHSNNSINNELTPSKSSDLYSDFAPIDLGEDDEHYEQIKFALEDENVKNLAILGAFGSGKSSVINSFFKNKSVYGFKIQPDEYVRVSFADFDYVNLNEVYFQSVQGRDNGKKSQEPVIDKYSKNFQSGDIEKKSKETETEECSQNGQGEDNVKKTKKTVKNEDKIQIKSIKSNKLSLKEVEYEIVRQLFHSNLIKDNKFANVILSYPSKIDIFVQTFILFVLIIAFFCKSLRDSYFSLYSTSIFLFCLTTILFIPFLYLTVSYFSRKLKLNKTSFGTVSVDFSEKNKLGAIDSYLNDIIYLFENSNCKYVILEDLDRTQNYEVFTHLRNLNFVLNNRLSSFNESRTQRSRIVFIYLLDDRIFSNPEEQIKFFDYSVTIIPAISSTTSGQVFLKKRDDINSFYFSSKILTDEFLLTISRFITDVRLINKIFNDYLLSIIAFEPIIQITKCSEEKDLSDSQKQLIKFLFSLVLFRTMYPLEYHSLLLEKDPIYFILNREYEKLGIELVEKNKTDLLRCNFKEFSDKYKIDLSIFKKIFGCNSDLLFYLLYSNSLSGCYRFFTSKPYKFNGNSQYLSREAISYLLELYSNGDKYNPDRFLHINEHFQVFFHYVPDFLVLNKVLFNFEFFENLISDDSNIKYNSFIRQCFLEIFNGKYEDDGGAFIVDFVDYLLKLKSKKDPLLLSKFLFEHLFCSFDKFIDDNKSYKKQLASYETELFRLIISQFQSQKSKLSIIGNIISEDIDKIYLFILTFLSCCRKEIIQIEKKENVRIFEDFLQNYVKSRKCIELLHDNDLLMVDSLFFSMMNLKVRFESVPAISNRSLENDVLFFYKFLNLAIYHINNRINPLSNVHECYFGFKANGDNFISIARSIDYLCCKNKNLEYDDKKQVKDNLITVFFEKYDQKLSNFYNHLFYHVVIYQNYDTIFDLLDLNDKIIEDNSPYLKDKPAALLLFITLINCYPTVCELSDSPNVRGVFLLNSFDSEHFTKKSDLLKLCFSMRPGFKIHESIIHFLLILELFSEDCDDSSINLVDIKPITSKDSKEHEKSSNINSRAHNLNDVYQESFNAVKDVMKLFYNLKGIKFNLFSSDTVLTSLIATFKNLLDYEKYAEKSLYKGDFSKFGIEIKKGKLRANILNVVYIGQFFDFIDENMFDSIEKNKHTVSNSFQAFFEECWNSLTSFFNSHYTLIYQSNLDLHICKLEPTLSNFNADNNKIKQYLKQICKQSTFTFDFKQNES